MGRGTSLGERGAVGVGEQDRRYLLNTDFPDYNSNLH